MTDQTPVPTIPVPGATPPANPAAPPVTSPGAPGTAAPPAPTRRPRAQRRGRGLPGVPLAVGAVNVATASAAEATMVGGPLAGLAVGAGALAAGVYAMRTNARYRRNSGTTAAALRRAMYPFGPSRTSGPGWSGGNGRTTGPGGRSGGLGSGPGSRISTGPRTSPDRTSGPQRSGRTSGGPGADQGSTGRTRRGLLGRTTDQNGGPGRTRPDHRRTKPSNSADRLHRIDRPSKVRRTVNGAKSVGRGIGATGRGIAATSRGVGRFGKKAVGSTRKGWRKSEKARSFVKRNGKRFGTRLAWPGIIALVTALRRRSWKAGVEAWRRKRNNTNITPPAPTVGNKVRDRKFIPADAGLGRVTATGGGAPSMTAAAFVQSSAEMMGAAAVYDPQGMMQVGNDLSQLPVALRNVAETMRIMTQRSNDNDPINPAIITKMGELYKALAAVAQSAEDLGPMFRSMHHVDIQRLEAPRRNEYKWDVTANR